MPNAAETEVVRLRVKIGADEFEAEGRHEVVAAHFEAWKQLIATRPPPGGTVQAPLPPADAAARPPTAGDVAAVDIFAADTRRDLVTLRASLGGPAAFMDAALLILYGYRQYFEADGQQVLATRLKKAMAASGYRRDRVDRTLARHVAARLIRRSGHRKGSTYELTPAGAQRAEALVQALRATSQPGAREAQPQSPPP